jgi:transposase
VSAREIGRRLGVARSTIQDNLKRAMAAGLAWPLADDVTEEALGSRPASGGASNRTGPNWRAS